MDIERLQAELATQTERADYAWRNAQLIDKARMEDRARFEAEIARLRHHLRELGKAADAAAMVIATIDAEDTTENEKLQEIMDAISQWAPDAMLQMNGGGNGPAACGRSR